MDVEKLKKILFCVMAEAALIVCVALANLSLEPLRYFFFYNVLYGVVFSFLVPLLVLRKEKGTLYLVGLKPLGKKQLLVLVLFVAFSVGGQLIPIVISGGAVPWNLLPMGVAPLIMTTFFEEFLFRGFFQTRFEKDFGALPAIFISGLMFSLYHIGYPGFRTFQDLLLLFAVGIGFAAAYKLSGSNLIVAYFVNLPNAFVTYLLKFEQFPAMGLSSTIASAITLCIIAVVLIVFGVAAKKGGKAKENESDGLG